jgi:hypothetical protein
VAYLPYPPTPDAKAQEGFEVVPQSTGAVSAATNGFVPPPRADDRAYDSEHEMWDDEERAATLAIGTMMLRRSKVGVWVWVLVRVW